MFDRFSFKYSRQISFNGKYSNVVVLLLARRTRRRHPARRGHDSWCYQQSSGRNMDTASDISQVKTIIMNITIYLPRRRDVAFRRRPPRLITRVVGTCATCCTVRVRRRDDETIIQYYSDNKCNVTRADARKTYISQDLHSIIAQ